MGWFYFFLHNQKAFGCVKAMSFPWLASMSLLWVITRILVGRLQDFLLLSFLSFGSGGLPISPLKQHTKRWLLSRCAQVTPRSCGEPEYNTLPSIQHLSKEAMPKWTTDGNFTLKVKGTWNQIKRGWLPVWCLVEKSSGGSSQKTNQWNWWIISNMLRN